MRRKKGRDVTGILLLDKPAGITSNRALQIARRCYNARKAGHTGSLDPLATGLLPLCFGEATKVSGFLLDADKHYEVTARLGAWSDTGDAEGDIHECRDDFRVTAEGLDRVTADFVGEIDQVPPMYSALKHQGQRLYDLARAGHEVERKARRVTIHSLTAAPVGEREARLSVTCSKGTYVRTLVEDIAAAMGTRGYVTALRRTALGPFQPPLRQVTMDEVEAARAEGYEELDRLLRPMDEALEAWPAVMLSADMAHFLRQGQAVFVPRAPEEGWVRLYERDRGFVGMGEMLADGRVTPKRLLASAARS